MICNKMFGTYPIMFHACGRLEFCPLWDQVRAIPPIRQSLPSSLTIVTMTNGGSHNNKESGVLQTSLHFAGVEFVVLGQHIINWKNSIKLKLLSDYLPSVMTEYILVADSSDVVLSGRLKSLVESIGNKCAIFNAERKQWPPNVGTDDFEKSHSTPEFPYLNAGLWIAKTKFAIEIQKFCNSLPIESHSEQIYYKHAYQEFYPDLCVDGECRLFQTLNQVNDDIISIPKTLI